jgi:hypothetical protein
VTLQALHQRGRRPPPLAPRRASRDLRSMPEQQHVWRIDGIEEDVARVEEDGQRMISLPRHLLPAGAREGQRLTVARTTAKGSVTLTVTIDEEGTAAELAGSKARTSAMLAQSRKRDPGGNVSL